ncbi:MAG TPA: pilus assembly protein TadG-related protein [Candidatus Limnocylindrales bacterium]|jgi:Flp pilus assembly protein TadG
MNSTERHAEDSSSGQVIVIFALALVALIAMVGLVLDGGSTFAQRRSQQSAADLASLAGANDYLLNHDATLATGRARAVAATNGFTHGTGGVTVDVIIATSNGVEVTVTIQAPHQNHFAGVVGMPTWPVGATATAQSGFPDSVVGAAPMLFSIDAFGPNGQPLAGYGNAGVPFTFDHGQGQSGDAPDAGGLMSWTDYDPLSNDNTRVMSQIINGEIVVSKTIDFGEYIGEHNNGEHAALFGELVFPADYPVPIVDHTGHFQGWATFHLTGASQGGRSVTGYFKSNYVSEKLTITSCSAAANDCPRYVGSYVLKLIN